MKSDWQSHLCNVNDSIASVFLDMGLADSAPLPNLPTLAWLWIRLQTPRDDGLSSDEEFDALCSYEDDLEKAVAGNPSCCYAGRITTSGRREFYFYVAENVDFKVLLDSPLKSHQEYMFQMGEKPDPAWRHYCDTLFPGPHGLAQIEKRLSEQ